jgi:hypothetical protein
LLTVPGRCLTAHILKEEGSKVVTKCDQLKLEASGTGRENGEEGGERGELSAARNEQRDKRGVVLRI